MSDQREPLTRLQALIQNATPDEVRVLTLLALRLAANRPTPGKIDLEWPSDGDGDLAGALQSAVDLALCASLGLTRARERRP